jgi:hypothetical protein
LCSCISDPIINAQSRKVIWKAPPTP